MPIPDFLLDLENTDFAIAIAESSWLFPTVETIHVIALAMVFGSIFLLDLRLLGVSRKDMGVMQLSNETLPWTWGAFVLAVITGTIMFVSSVSRYLDNDPFLIKMGLIALAGVNMAVFHMTAYRTVHSWNHVIPTPVGARVAASFSIVFWIGVIIAGRWIGFT